MVGRESDWSETWSSLGPPPLWGSLLLLYFCPLSLPRSLLPHSWLCILPGALSMHAVIQFFLLWEPERVEVSLIWNAASLLGPKKCLTVLRFPKPHMPYHGNGSYGIILPWGLSEILSEIITRTLGSMIPAKCTMTNDFDLLRHKKLTK